MAAICHTIPYHFFAMLFANLRHYSTQPFYIPKKPGFIFVHKPTAGENRIKSLEECVAKARSGCKLSIS